MFSLVLFILETSFDKNALIIDCSTTTEYNVRRADAVEVALVVNIPDKSNNLQTFLRATKPKCIYIVCVAYTRVEEMGKIGCQRENDNGIQSAR